MGIVSKSANAFASRFPGVDRDGLVSDGHLALIRIASSFSPTRGATFRTAASRAVRNAMIDHVRAEQRYQRAIDEYGSRRLVRISQ